MTIVVNETFVGFSPAFSLISLQMNSLTQASLNGRFGAKGSMQRIPVAVNYRAHAGFNVFFSRMYPHFCLAFLHFFVPSFSLTVSLSLSLHFALVFLLHPFNFSARFQIRSLLHPSLFPDKNLNGECEYECLVIAFIIKVNQLHTRQNCPITEFDFSLYQRFFCRGGGGDSSFVLFFSSTLSRS